MKTAIKLATIGLIVTSVAQSADDQRFLRGNPRPNNDFGQSILLDPSIGDKILEDDLKRIQEFSLKEYEEKIIKETKIKSEKRINKTDLEEISELLMNIALADSIAEEKINKQIEEDEIFALQNEYGRDLEQSFYGDDYLLAMQLSLQQNLGKKPIEMKAPERPDIKIQGILDVAGMFLTELRDNIIKTDYPDYFRLLKELSDETLALEQMETMQNVNNMDINIKKIDIATLEAKIKEIRLLVLDEIQSKYNALDKVKALMEKFNINKKNAKEIIDFCCL